jgi:hypothetical protein
LEEETRSQLPPLPVEEMVEESSDEEDEDDDCFELSTLSSTVMMVGRWTWIG